MLGLSAGVVKFIEMLGESYLFKSCQSFSWYQ